VGARTKARKRALDVLYAADLRGVSARVLLNEAVAAGEEPRGYTVVLVDGVSDRREEIDAILGRYSEAWTVDRMPAVDRNLLRIAVFEVLSGQVDAPVAVSEAVTLAGSLSTDDSPSFVNGVLGKLVEYEPAFAAAVALPVPSDADASGEGDPDDDDADDDDRDEINDDEFSHSTEIIVETDDDDFGDHFKDHSLPS
jgi:N utilization substance protein B